MSSRNLASGGSLATLIVSGRAIELDAMPHVMISALA
jgi:hypothetical protein